MRSIVSAIRNATPVTPVPLSSRVSSVLASLTGSGPDDVKNMQKYGEVGTLFSTVNLLASATAQVKWHLFQHSDGRGRISSPDPRREVTSHAALDLINHPNNFMPWQVFSETFQQHLDLTGKCFWVIQRSPIADIPLGMWPVRPDRMTPVPDADQFLLGWVYTGPNAEQIPLRVQDVIWLRYPDPMDPYGGIGPVQAILTSLEASKYVDEYNRNFFKNSAEPGGIVQIDKRLTDDEFDELTERWAEQHQGVNRAHRVAFLEQGATWVNRQYTMKDMEFSTLRTMGRDIVYEAFGVGKALLGVVDDVNRANIEGSEYIFAKYRLVSRLERIKGALNEQLLPLFGSAGKGVEFDYENPVPADWQADATTMEAQSKAVLALIEAGFDPLDAVASVGMPKMGYIGPPAKLALPPLTAGTDTATAADTSTDSSGSGEDDDVDSDESDTGTEDDDDSGNATNKLLRSLIAQVAELKGQQPVVVHNHLGGRAGRAQNLHNSLSDPTMPRRAPKGTPATIDTKKLKFDHVQSAWKSERDRLLAGYAAIKAAQKADLVKQIKAKVMDGKSDFASIAASNEHAHEAVLDSMSRLWPVMAQHVVDDAKSQGVHKGIKPATYDAESMSSIADNTTQLLADELAVSAARKATNSWTDNVAADVLADIVTSYLDGLSDANDSQQLGSALTATQNAARSDTYDNTYPTELPEPVASLYAVEVMDDNTCDNCAAIDGNWIGNTDDDGDSDAVDDLYPDGGYVDCLGGDRCRGTITGVWRTATTDGSDDDSDDDSGDDGGGE